MSEETSSPDGRRAAARDPLHGVTLAMVLDYLVRRYGWAAMAERIPVRCFMFEPSAKSSLTFLRRTPWARAQVEAWYVEDRRRMPAENPWAGWSAKRPEP
jgi:uncharacterized protein (DUF2132 family)